MERGQQNDPGYDRSGQAPAEQAAENTVLRSRIMQAPVLQGWIA